MAKTKQKRKKNPDRDKENKLEYKTIKVEIDNTDAIYLAQRLYERAFKNGQTPRGETRLAGRIIPITKRNSLETRIYAPKNPLSVYLPATLLKLEDGYDALIKQINYKEYAIRFSSRINPRIVERLHIDNPSLLKYLG